MTNPDEGGELTVEQQLANEVLHKRRLRIEHVNMRHNRQKYQATRNCT